MRSLTRPLLGRRDERGVSAIELSFLAPGLIFLIFFVIQGGLFFYGKAVAIQAAREGVSQLRLAQDSTTYLDVKGRISANTENFATTVGREALLDPVATPSYDEQAGRVSMEVRGGVISLLPWLHLEVSAEAEGAIERFEPEAPVMRRRARGERGSLAVEMAIVVPSLLLIFGLIYAYGRAATVNGTLESGTRDAARSATIARSYDDAKERAERVVREAIVDLPQSCQNSLVVTVSRRFEAGEPITVDAECTYELSDLGLPGAPGDITPRSSFTSMLDPYRGIE